MGILNKGKTAVGYVGRAFYIQNLLHTLSSHFMFDRSQRKLVSYYNLHFKGEESEDERSGGFQRSHSW